MEILKTLGAALAVSLAAGNPANAAETVRFGTNWLAQAEHGGFFQAAHDGTYQACGLDVEIVSGGPMVNNRALLSAGKIDFYMGGNMLHPYAAVEQGIPTKVVAALFQKDPQILMTHPGQGLDSWEKLKDIPLFISNSGFHAFFPWMQAAFGFDPAKRKVYAYSSAPFLADPRSGQQGYLTSEPFAIEREAGFKPNVFLLADYGFDTYSTTIEAREDTIANRKGVVQCFVDGSILGWITYLYGDRSAGDAAILAANPEMTAEQIAYSVEKMKEYGLVESGDAVILGIGAMTEARHKSFFDKMVAAGVVKADLDLSKAYTLEFVNKGIGNDLLEKLKAQ